MDLGSYLAFQKDDLIKVLAADRATGWWYGYVITSFDQIESTARKGYFPSNYIKLLQSGDQDQKNREELQRLEQEKRQAETEKILEKARQAQTGSSSGSSYMDYVNSRFADREQLTIYHRRQESLKTERPVMSREEKHQQDVSEAYKKFGIGSKNPASMVMRRPGNRADGFKRKNVSRPIWLNLTNF